MTNSGNAVTDPSHAIHTVRTRTIGGVAISEISVEPQTAHHILDECDDQSVSMLSVQIAGTAKILSSDQNLLMHPGDVGVFHSSQPATVVARNGYRSVCLTIPQYAVDVPLRELSGAVLPSTKGVVPAFSTLLISIIDTLDTVSATTLTRLFNSAVELGTALLLDELGSTPGVDHHTRMKMAMYTYIEENLSDPDLDVNRLANVHHVSVRHVHNIFRPGGHSAAATIRRRRIERARQDLTNAGQFDVPVAIIAARWGFTSASHFGQLFKHVVGCTPASYRQSMTSFSDAARPGLPLSQKSQLEIPTLPTREAEHVR